MVPALLHMRKESISVNREVDEMEEYTPEFIKEMQEAIAEEPVFIGTLEEFDKFLDMLDCDE